MKNEMLVAYARILNFVLNYLYTHHHMDEVLDLSERVDLLKALYNKVFASGLFPSHAALDECVRAFEIVEERKEKASGG